MSIDCAIKCARQMFTQPKVVLPKKAEDRAYVTFYYNGKRLREYNGNRLNLNINPNQFSSTADKLRLLNKLAYEFNKALTQGWNPFKKEKQRPNLKCALQVILAEKTNSTLSAFYKRNLIAVHRMFTDFLTAQELNEGCDDLGLCRVEDFLNQFQTSERNYINRRRCLSLFFNEMVRKDFATQNIVNKTKSPKSKASLHVPYSDKKLKDILNYLKINYPNLHLCCLLTYGCLLRPHHEIRLLKLKHVVEDYTKIQLSGSENKSKKVRTVYIPEYVQKELKDRLSSINDNETNIFSLNNSPYNVGYFNVMWGKAKSDMIKARLLEPNQTIYSFRHTAAIKVYRKSKDLQLLQQLLQHSNMIVTLNYLRGLGEVHDERLKKFMPEL